MTDPAKAGKWTYLGLCITTLSTLMFEILLTRIFSVTMWYHYAFVAISLAMFGMTVGALVVYLLPRVFVKDRVRPHLCLTSLFFALAIVVCFLVHLGLPLLMKANRNVAGPLSAHVLVLTYIVVSIPFVFSGMAVSLALTRFPAQIGKLYGVDLAGAALGCFLLILVLDITDGPTAVIVVAALACDLRLSRVFLDCLLYSFGVSRQYAGAPPRTRECALTVETAILYLAVCKIAGYTAQYVS